MPHLFITGDIIHSAKSGSGGREQAMQSFKGAMNQWKEEFGLESELIRGDSFQCLIPKAHLALQIALLMRTYLRSPNPMTAHYISNSENPETSHSKLMISSPFDARIAIGIGGVDYWGDTVGRSDGEALHLSWRALDQVRASRQNLAISSLDESAGELATMAILLDAILSKTTALQCEVINLKLLGHTEVGIAALLEIQQSAVNQRSKAGNWNAMHTAIKRFNKIYEG